MMDGGEGGTGVEVRGLTVRYGSLTAVDGVDLTVAPGEVVGLIGPNGAGKTSLLECVEGLRTPASGQIRVAGLDPITDRTRLARLVGVQLQDSAFPTRAKVGEVCALFAGFYPDPVDPGELLGQFGLTDQAGQLVNKLSGGQQQRLALVLALLGRPRLVVLDELTTGLDPAARRAVWEGLRTRNEQGLTVLITSHHMDEVEYLCDRVLVLRSGRLVAEGTVSELIAAHGGSSERLVVEHAGAQAALREELVALGAGLRLTPTGNRLHVDIVQPALRGPVTELLRRHEVTSRAVPASLEDVYLSLTGEQAGVQEEASSVR